MGNLALFIQQWQAQDDYEFHELKETFEAMLPETTEVLLGSELDNYLQVLLGDERYVLWRQLIEIALKTRYSQSYYHRSYRAPDNPKKNALAMLEILKYLTTEVEINLYGLFQSSGQITYMNGNVYYVDEDEKPFLTRDLFPYLLALKLNEQDAQIEEYVREILWKNGAHPLYSKDFVQGVLMSDRPDLYKLVGDVLLAAKNQEGTRQVIVETIDEGTLEAQMYFMELIVAHDLTRFSSVVRAIDVWFGLGYEAKNKKEVNYVLTESLAALKDTKRAKKLLISESSLDVFIGFWVHATQDIDDMLLKVEALMQQKPHIQQTVLYALHHTELTGVGQLIYPYMLETKHLHTFLYAFPLLVDYIPGRYYYDKRSEVEEVLHRYFDERPWLLKYADGWLEQLETFAAKMKGETYEIEGTPFPFLHLVFNKQQFYELRILLLCMLERTKTLVKMAEDVKSLPVAAREYYYHCVSQLAGCHELLIPALQDRSIAIRKQAIDALSEAEYPLAKFKDAVPKLLTLKTGEIRQAVIALLAEQPIKEVEALASELLLSKKEAVRLGILDLLIKLKDYVTQDFSKIITKPTEKEQQLIAQLAKAEETFATAPLPPLNEKLMPHKAITYTFKDLIHFDFKPLKEKLLKLARLIESHQNVSYPVENYAGEHYDVLLGQTLDKDARKSLTTGSIDHLALSEEWTKWLVDSSLTDEEVCVFLYMRRLNDSYFMSTLTAKGKKFIEGYFENQHPSAFLNTFAHFPFYEHITIIMSYVLARGQAPLQRQLTARFKGIDYVQFCSSMLMDFYENVQIENGMMNYYNEQNSTLDIYFFFAAFQEMENYAKTAKQSVQLLYTASLFYGDDVEMFQLLSVDGLMSLFIEGIVDERHMRRLLLTEAFHYVLSKDATFMKALKKLPRFDEVMLLINEVTEFIVEQELARGDSETAVTRYVSDISSIDASKYFVRLLKELGKEKLSRQWLYQVQTRKESLSLLLQKLDVTNIDKQAFFAQLDEANFEPKRLIEVMLYHTSLISLLSEYVGWPGLAQTAWYFVAHTADSTTDYEKAKINEYSEIAIEDFERGSFDRKWFMAATKAMKPSHFDVVYDAAKYSTSGAKHRRAQLYARASLGELDAAELRKEIEVKRNQDKLRAYSLLPATWDEAKERYLYLQQFLKESKQFGAQRKASEAATVEMAIQNLAEQVANGNATQFMWQMEHERFLELQQFFTPQTIEDVTLQLVSEDAGRLTLMVIKGEKSLKSVPKKIAKNAQVIAMQDARKELMAQYKRARMQLERAMCEEIPFDSTIIYTLAKNAIFEELLSKIIWQQGRTFYQLKDGAFSSLEGNVVKVKGNIQVAHPYHLYKAGIWRAWQQQAYKEQWQQPFKQLFRELYLVTEDEKQKAVTNRFEGYQVQPQKAIALLKSRGWKTGYYEPIRKISYHYNTVTVIDFVYDYYTSAEVEAPTLEEITFVERLTRKLILLQDVSAVHFSEVLRDIDLVVSVAYVGEVDPEASHSTIEVRAVIVEEMANLLQLSNVRVQLPYALIEGELATYSIHLGSGNIHQLGGTQIPVLAVPSQHRGRVFLPFVDDDPKTAEIASKVLLFADDSNITDPMIRQYINK